MVYHPLDKVMDEWVMPEHITIPKEKMMHLYMNIENHLMDLYKNHGYSKYEILETLKKIIEVNEN